MAAIRTVARGERALPRITKRMQAQAAALLGMDDRAIFAMRLAGTAPGDIADTVGLSVRELEASGARIIALLASETPA